MERVEKGGAKQGGWTVPALGLMARPCMHAAAFMLMMVAVSDCEASQINFAVIRLGANRCYQIVAGNGPGFTRLDTATNHVSWWGKHVWLGRGTEPHVGLVPDSHAAAKIIGP